MLTSESRLGKNLGGVIFVPLLPQFNSIPSTFSLCVLRGHHAHEIFLDCSGPFYHLTDLCFKVYLKPFPSAIASHFLISSI